MNWSAAIGLAVACTLLPAPALAADGHGVVSTITDERVTESSGLVQSTRDAALAYTVNDSGSGPVVYVVELDSGDVVGTATLTGTSFVDAEALALGADRRLYVADIGDNEGVRRSVDLYAIDQPSRGDVSVSPVRHRVRYSGGPRDAESLISDAVDGSFYIASKAVLGGELYRLDDLREGEVTLARPVDDMAVPGLATDADVLPERGGVVLRTYSDAYVFAVPGWDLLATVELPEQRQGETVAVIDGGPRIYAGTEGLPSDLIGVDLPVTALRELDARRAVRDREQRGGSAEDSASDESQLPLELLAGGALLLLIGCTALVALLRRRAG